MIRHKKSIRSVVSAILLAVFLVIIPVTFADHVESTSARPSISSASQNSGLLTRLFSDDEHAALLSANTTQQTDMPPHMFLLAGSFGIAIVGTVSILVVRLGPESNS